MWIGTASRQSKYFYLFAVTPEYVQKHRWDACGFAFFVHFVLLARVSSHAHPPADPNEPPRLCENCGAGLSGPYCAQCGQHDVDYHRSFRHLIHEILENLFHFEGKFLVTVAWLVAKPGQLTKEFNAGRRQAQLNPLRFYLFVTVLFFFVLTFFNHGHLFPIEKGGEIDRSMQASVKTSIAAVESAELKGEQKQVYKQLIRQASKDGKLKAAAPAEIAKVLHEIAEEAKKTPPGDPSSKTGRKITTVNDPNASPGATITIDESTDIGKRLAAKFASGELTPAMVFAELEHRIGPVLCCALPLFALLLKLFYIRRERFYIQHLIFSLHLHTWAFMAFLLADGYGRLAALGPNWLFWLFVWAFVGWVIWYPLMSFRVVYGQSWRKIIVKCVLLGGLYSMVLLTLCGAAAWFTAVVLAE